MSHVAARGPARGAVAYAAGSVVLWPVIESLEATLFRTQPPVQTVWLRYAAHVAVVLVVTLPRSGWSAFATRRAGLQVIRGLLMAGMPVVFLLGLAGAPASDVWSVFWVAPVLVLLAASMILGERASPVRWLGTLVGFVGALLVLTPHRGLPAALPMGFLMAVTFAGYLLLSRELMEESITASLLFTGVGALLPLAVLLRWNWVPVPLERVGIVLALGVASVLFFGCLNRAVELADASFVGPLLYAVLPAEAALRWALEDERPGRVGLVGLTLVGVALFLVLRIGRHTAHVATEGGA